jgi:hypothetical protein
MNDFLELDMHPFVDDVLQKGVAVTKFLGDRHPSRVVPEYSREPDEHEFFLLRVSASMVEVLNCCHQLHQIPILLANHRQTASMEKAGINRHSQLIYHIENYLIRTQSLLDRILKLIDAVFHLTNDPRHCRYDVVMRNVKVQVSDILPPLKELKKVLDRYAITRNEVIHHHSITDDRLRRLDMYFIADRWKRFSPKESLPDFGALIKETVFEVLWFRKKEFVAFNKQIAGLLEQIFDKLVPYYAREERALRVRLEKPID